MFKFEAEDRVKFELPDLKDETVLAVLDKTFNYLSNKTVPECAVHIVEAPAKPEVIIEPLKKASEDGKAGLLGSRRLANEKKVSLDREPKVYAHKESEGFTIADKVDLSKLKIEQQEEPDFWKTGIKEKNGEPHYRCRYLCPSCGTVSNHYILKDTDTVNCHECDEEMEVVPMDTAIGKETDSHGNWYIAGHYQVRE